jgi:hypothetical protein
MRFFFYGTLLDPDIRRLVFPHLHRHLSFRPAELRGYWRVRAKDGPYPVLKPDPKGRVHGQIAEGLDLPALARAAHFEGATYHPAVRRLHVRDAGALRAWVFVPAAPRRQASGKPWNLETWQRSQKPQALRHTAYWMAEFRNRGLAGADISWHGRRMLRRLADEIEGVPADDTAFRIDEAA